MKHYKTGMFRVVNFASFSYRRAAWGAILSCIAISVKAEVEGYRDPTTPLYQVNSAVEQSPLQLTLTSIANLDHLRFAIINGQRLYEGDMIMGAKIIKISKKSVQYTYNGKDHWISVEVVFNQDEASYESQ